jgi:multicomponent K+:H+ antiporter subunit E
MRRWLPYPVIGALLLAMWLVLSPTVVAGDFVVGAMVVLGASFGLSALRAPRVAPRRPRAALALAWLVLADIVRSNIAVARIVLHRGTRDQTSGFVRIPLDLRNPVGLAALACIITATPGTAWGRYDSTRSILVMHILDLVDEQTWIHTIKDRYERRLLEIFE